MVYHALVGNQILNYIKDCGVTRNLHCPSTITAQTCLAMLWEDKKALLEKGKGSSIILLLQVMCNSLYGNETDRLSLLDFKKAISLDPKQVLASWNDSTYFCSWEGVSCSSKDPHRVISLNLTDQGLVGQISPLGNLTFLRHLHLPVNLFTGEIPPSLGHLHHLQTLYLSNNSLQGKIPNLANCSNLMVLELYRNNLVGQFPEDLPDHLQKLQLSYNKLTGPIPASL
uniref:Leucine-rich repeat-containing N-terminal plant-type domain-containing protein n=1 Tax=Oryza brachyantha TaxID=4533 RepID=J3N6D7_ORYBR